MRIALFCCLLFFTSFTLFSNSFIVKLSDSFDRSDFLRELEFHKVDISNVSIKALAHFKVDKTPTILNSKKESLSRYFVVESLADGGLYLVDILSKIPFVEFVEPNFTLKIEVEPNKEQDFDKQWYLEFVRSTEAWKNSTGKWILVAIIDTGIEFDHSELSNQIYINPLEDINGNGKFDTWPSDVEINGVLGDLNGIDNDGNGYIDDVAGYDFVDLKVANFGDYFERDPVPFDENGHGTMVAGVIAAERNGSGIVGLAYDAKILPIRAFDVSGTGELKDVASAIIYAAEFGAKVINMSFGTKAYSKLLEESIEYARLKGCIMIASAGNDGLITPHFPSDFEGVISVGSIKPDGFISNTSNYGSNVDIFAPGVQIYTTKIGNNYGYASGTSFSAPIVSAVCALVLSLYPEYDARHLVSIFKATQRQLKGKAKDYNIGAIDAAEVLNFIGTSVFTLEGIENDDVFRKSLDSIEILVSSYSPFFKNYQLCICQKDSQQNILLTDIVYDQCIKKKYVFSFKELREGKYNIKLISQLTNGNVIEVSKRFYVVDDSSQIKLIQKQVFFPIFENGTIPYVYLETSIPTYCYYRIYDEDKLLVANSNSYYSVLHSFPVMDLNVSSNRLKFVFTLRSKSGKELTDTLIVGYFDRFGKQKPFSGKYKSLPISYVFNKVFEFGNQRCLLLNTFDELQWSDLVLYSFQDTAFVEVGKLKEPWIPVDTGETNGDGKIEILTTLFGKTKLFQIEDLQNPFGKILFESPTDEILWAGKLWDFDYDGKQEIICYNDTAILIFKHNAKNVYSSIKTITIPKELGLIGTKPNILVGDFNRNGKFDISFITTKGFLVVVEIGSDYSTDIIYSKQLEGDSFSTALALSSNFDNEIQLFALLPVVNNEQIEERHLSTLWNLYRLSYSNDSGFSLAKAGVFFGGRFGSTPQGYFYRNGIACGDVNGDGGDELFVSVFPNLYVLAYDGSVNQFTSILWLPYVYTNNAVVYDFDGNGVQEFGISTWGGFRFFEFDVRNKLNTITYFDGWLDTLSKLHFRWNSVGENLFYEIYSLDSNNMLNLVAISENNEISLDFVPKSGWADFTIRAKDNRGVYEPSDFSAPKRIYFLPTTKPLFASILNGKEIMVGFSGRLPREYVSVSFAKLLEASNKEIRISNVYALNDTAMVIKLVDDLRPTNYRLVVHSIRDFWGNETLSGAFTLAYSKPLEVDSNLYIRKFEFLSDYTFVLHFSEELDSISALDIRNWVMYPVGSVRSVSFGLQVNQLKIELDDSFRYNSLGFDVYIQIGKIYSSNRKKSVNPPFNTICISKSEGDISNAFAYPNPFVFEKDEYLSFANVPKNSVVEIYNSRFEKLIEFENSSWKGGIQIDKDKLIEFDFNSGIYYFRIRKFEENGREILSKVFKFAVVR